MQLKIITKSEFDRLDISRRILVNDDSNQYALLDLGNKLGCYGISWGSFKSEPIVQLADAQVWLGVEQQLAMIRLTDGLVSLIMPLHTPILKIVAINNTIAVLTELEVILFNSNGLLRCFLGLPELAEDITFEKGIFSISLFDGVTLTLNSDKSTFNESVEDYISSQSHLMLR